MTTLSSVPGRRKWGGSKLKLCAGLEEEDNDDEDKDDGWGDKLGEACGGGFSQRERSF